MNPQDTVTKQEFLDSLFEIWNPEPKIEVVPVSAAEGRILAEDQFAKYNLPVVRASQMDGIAVKSEAFRDGAPDTSQWELGVDYVRADTGDDFDDAFDAVIMIEQVEFCEDGGLILHLREGQVIEPGTMVAPSGSQLQAGTLAAVRGQSLHPVSIASLIKAGITEVPVIVRPRVGYIPTGSELVPPGTVPGRGDNIDCNSALVEGLVRRFGGIPTCYDIVKDDPDALSAALDRAIAENDIVLMSGGSSKGEEDYTTRLFEQHSTLLTHWVRAVPGRPMSVAIHDEIPLINLSGPSVAAMNGMLWCVNAVMAHFMGTRPYWFPTEIAVLDEDLHAPGFMEALCTLMVTRGYDGVLHASQTGRSLTSNAFYITSIGEEFLEAGSTIEACLLCSPSEY